MKRQLDRLKGKRLVTGDPNLMTKDEICINATPNGVEVKEIGTDGKIKELAGGSGSNSGGSGDSEVKEYEYYEINFNGLDEDQTFALNTALQFYYYSDIVGLYDNVDGKYVYGEVAHTKTTDKNNFLTVKLLKDKYPYVLVAIDDGNHGTIMNLKDIYEVAGTNEFDFCIFVESMGLLTKEEIDNHIIKLTEEQINKINSELRYKNPII